LASRIEVQPSESKLQKPPTFRPYQIRWANDTSRLAMMVKATQIGISTATAGWAIFKRCLRIPNHLVILLSRSERQSLELARKCKGLIDAFEGIKADLYEGRPFQRTEKKQHQIVRLLLPWIHEALADGEIAAVCTRRGQRERIPVLDLPLRPPVGVEWIEALPPLAP
jgi:hypothetical protein